MIKKFYLLLIFSFLTSAVAFAQQTNFIDQEIISGDTSKISTTNTGSVDFHFNALGWLDNREYKAFIPRSRTYSGTRTEIDFGLNIDSLNHFIVGTNAIHEFGAIPYFLNAVPVAYYNFKNAHWLFNAGEFPRAGLIDDYPRAMLNDTLMYYRPNVEGLLAKYSSNNFTETGWIDWVSRQTDTQREEFLFGAEGKYTPNTESPFYIRNYFLEEHDAGAAILQPDDHIFDNVSIEIRLGLDFSHKTVFDSLSFEAGNLSSFLRERGVTGWQTKNGFVFSAYAGYHRFGIFEEFYKGQGSIIYYGDSYYEKSFYNRIDLSWTPFLSGRVKGQFIASFHFSPGHFNDNQEVFRVTYDIGRKTIARFKD
ncbi:hypothetical protein HDF18_02560 [Mucilaginibacter sp. X5P1]|uniref:hypothetical protein n=1 Tax=Mucilaginibacter sp. X5P1 TaxID=2723088 RepID=UPI00161A231E|nr:hypothetical protein [Mucilaginibacter sp. X5P1]MBB6138002.1 hypothetical protein [Mucilaginibacter sp. X5P1]